MIHASSDQDFPDTSADALDLVRQECIVKQNSYFALDTRGTTFVISNTSIPNSTINDCCAACHDNSSCDAWQWCTANGSACIAGTLYYPPGTCALLSVPGFSQYEPDDVAIVNGLADSGLIAGAPLIISLPALPNYRLSLGFDFGTAYDYACPISTQPGACVVNGTAWESAAACDADPSCGGFAYYPRGVDYDSSAIGILKEVPTDLDVPGRVLDINPFGAAYVVMSPSPVAVPPGTPGALPPAPGPDTNHALLIALTTTLGTLAVLAVAAMLLAWRRKRRRSAPPDAAKVAEGGAGATAGGDPGERGGAKAAGMDAIHAAASNGGVVGGALDPPSSLVSPSTDGGSAGPGGDPAPGEAPWPPYPPVARPGDGSGGSATLDSAPWRQPASQGTGSGSSGDVPVELAALAPLRSTWPAPESGSEQVVVSAVARTFSPSELLGPGGYLPAAPGSARDLLDEFARLHAPSNEAAVDYSALFDGAASRREGGAAGAGEAWYGQAPPSQPGQQQDWGGEAQLLTGGDTWTDDSDVEWAAACAASASAAVGHPPDDAWQLAPEDVTICRRGDGSFLQIGAGAFGTVFRGVYRGRHTVAVKVLHRAADERRSREFAREVTLLKALSHRHVVKFLGACTAGQMAMLVTEFMELGDLWRALPLVDAAGQRIFSWRRRGIGVALDVARGLQYLHAQKVVHLDLKSANILLSRSGTAKIADVGFARVLQKSYLSVLSGLGTLAWSAPEVLAGRRCSEKADIYSYGVLLWEIVCGEGPVRGRMRAPQVPEECPAVVAALIAACCAEDPADRPSAPELVASLRAMQA